MGWTPRFQWIKSKGRKPYGRVQIGGKKIHLGTDRRAAEKRFGELMAGREPFGIPEWFAEAVAACNRIQLDAQRKFGVDNFIAWNPRLTLAEIDARLLEKYVTNLQSTGLAAKTIRHYVYAVRKVLSWCEDCGWAKKPPAPKNLPRAERHPRDIPLDKLAEVVNKISKKGWPIIGFILNTGCRPSEAARLRWEHVRLADGFCELPPTEHKTGKRTGRPKIIQLTPAAVEILNARKNREGLVFPSQLGTPYTRHGLRSIMRRAGYGRVYSLRHTFAQHALESQPIEVVAALLGHSDLSTVQVYAQIRNRRAQAAAQSLAPPVRREDSPPKPAKKRGAKAHRRDIRGSTIRESARGKSGQHRPRRANGA